VTRLTRSGGGAGRSIAVTVIGNMAAPLVGIVVAPILARSLGVEGRGAVAAATAPVLLASVVATLGIAEAVTYYTARAGSNSLSLLKRSIVLLLVSGVAASATIYSLAQPLSGGDASIAELIGLCAGAAAPTVALGALRGAAAGLHWWATIALERYMLAFLRLIPILVLLLIDALSVFSAAIVMAYSPVVAGCLYLSAGLSKALHNAGSQVSARQLMSFSLRLWLGSIAGVLLTRLDQVLLTPLAGPAELGLYAVAVNLADVPLMISLASRDVLIAADAGVESNKRLAMASRLTSLVTLVLSVCLGCTAPLWIGPLFGAGFSEAVPVLCVLLAACVFGVPGSIAGAGLIARNSPQLRSLVVGAAVPVNVGLLFVLGPAHGALGAAVATLGGTIVASGGALLLLRRRHRVAISRFFGLRAGDLRFLSHTVRKLAARASPRE